MRRSLIRSGLLPAAAALVLLTGCSGSDDEPAAAEGTTAAEETTTAEETTPRETTASESPDAAGSEFCTEATGIVERLTAGVTAGNPADLPETFQGAAQEIRALEAPEELAADWNALADGVEQVATTLQGVDPTDPDALATLQERLAPLQQQLSQSSSNVERYLVDECGLERPTGTSAPTS